MGILSRTIAIFGIFCQLGRRDGAEVNEVKGKTTPIICVFISAILNRILDLMSKIIIRKAN